MKKVYYKSPIDNKVRSGSLDELSQNDTLLYFDVMFFMTYKEAKAQPDYKN